MQYLVALDEASQRAAVDDAHRDAGAYMHRTRWYNLAGRDTIPFVTFWRWRDGMMPKRDDALRRIVLVLLSLERIDLRIGRAIWMVTILELAAVVGRLWLLST
jgi:hypothetical protein